MVTACDRIWEVDALREGRLGERDAASFERHRATCAECDERFRQDERLRALGRALPGRALDALEARRQRTALLRDAARAAPSRNAARLIAGAACAVTVVLALLFVWRGSPMAVRATTTLTDGVTVAAASASSRSSELAAIVHASSGAAWSQQREGDVETVALEAGTVVVEVRRQRERERFLVAMPDGEIEVRGTVFEVTVNGGRTLAVDVREGTVVLRLRGRAEMVLRAGESWPVTAAVASGASRAPAARASAPPRPSSTPSLDVARDEYDAAMRTYRAREYEAAARAFHTFAAAHPTSPEAEDAAFLEAASLAFVGRADAAALVAERFLDRFPRSFHAKDAAVLVARVARNRGDCERARRVLVPWSTTGASDVRAALGACAP